MGGHAGGDVASAIATRRIAEADGDYDSAPDAAAALRGRPDRRQPRSSPRPWPSTPSSPAWARRSARCSCVGDYVVIAHIGDSRIYLLPRRRARARSPPTTRSCSASSTPAASPPRRRRCTRAARCSCACSATSTRSPEIDIHRARHPSRRPLAAVLRRPLGRRRRSTSIARADARPTPAPSRPPTARQAGARRRRARQRHGRDRRHRRDPPAPATPPLVVGSAAAPARVRARRRSRCAPAASGCTTLRPHPVQETHFEPDSAEYLDELIEEDAAVVADGVAGSWSFWIVAARRRDRRRVRCSATSGRRRATTSASHDGRVAIFQGIQQDIGPISLHELHTETTIDVADLPHLRPAARRADDQRRLVLARRFAHRAATGGLR